MSNANSVPQSDFDPQKAVREHSPTGPLSGGIVWPPHTPRLQPTIAIDLEDLSARLHEVYQKEARRRGDVRHADAYHDLPEATKEWDRVLARWVLRYWSPDFDAANGLPPA